MYASSAAFTSTAAAAGLIGQQTFNADLSYSIIKHINRIFATYL
jgi:hypothetical protein